jgi:hypothetical protein
VSRLSGDVTYLNNFDFLAAKVKLVASVPGTFKNNEFGHARLKLVSSSWEFYNENSFVDYQVTRKRYYEFSLHCRLLQLVQYEVNGCRASFCQVALPVTQILATKIWIRLCYVLYIRHTKK